MAKILVLDKGGQQGSDAAGLMARTFCAPCLLPCLALAFTTLRCMLHRQGDLVFSTSVRANAGHLFCLFTGRFGIVPWGVAQMLKWEEADLLFISQAAARKGKR